MEGGTVEPETRGSGSALFHTGGNPNEDKAIVQIPAEQTSRYDVSLRGKNH